MYISSVLDQEYLKDRFKLIPYNPDPRETLSKVANCFAFIGTKYHSCLFAYLSDLPLLIINYHPKCKALADEIKLPPVAVITLEEILSGEFSNRIKFFIENTDSFIPRLPIKNAMNTAEEGLKKLPL